MEVTACSNNILVAADEMQAGATQQDQEITNTSSAVEELTVSMKQVSNNAEASAEAARRALDQLNRQPRCGDTLEACSVFVLPCRLPRRKSSPGDRPGNSEIINVINDITEKLTCCTERRYRSSAAGEAVADRSRCRRSSQACGTQP